MSWIELFLGHKGRLTRRAFWLASLVPVAVHLLAAAAHDAAAGGPAPAFAAGVAAYSIVMLNTKRLHDLGKPGWLQLVLIASLGLWLAAYASMAENNAPLTLALAVPALAGSLWSTWIGFQMLAFPGETEENRFGPPEATETRNESRAALEAEVAEIVARAERKKAAVPQEPTLNDILAAAAKAESEMPASRFGRRRPASA